MNTMHRILRVNTEFDLKHFIRYTSLNTRVSTITLMERHEKFHLVDINSELFEIHEDVLSIMLIKCNHLTLQNKVLQ